MQSMCIWVQVWLRTYVCVCILAVMCSKLILSIYDEISLYSSWMEKRERDGDGEEENIITWTVCLWSWFIISLFIQLVFVSYVKYCCDEFNDFNSFTKLSIHLHSSAERRRRKRNENKTCELFVQIMFGFHTQSVEIITYSTCGSNAMPHTSVYFML